jgi:AcrR family transcriptional regulator
VGRKTERRNLQGEESRRRILEATFEIANELGYDGTSIAKVSERSGLPASSVYWHFASKDDLFAEVIQHSFDAFLAARPRWDVSVEEDRRAMLRERMRATVATYASSPEFWRLGLMLTLEHRIEEPTARARFRQIRRDMIGLLARWWARILPPDVSAREPELHLRLAQFTMAATDGLFVASQAADDWDLDRLADMLAASLDMLADG